jgi:hypothetical protein
LLLTLVVPHLWFLGESLGGVLFHYGQWDTFYDGLHS